MSRLLDEALRSGGAPPPPVNPASATLLVAGGGGALGSAVLENVLAAQRFRGVRVLVTQPLRASLPGLETVAFDGPDTPVAEPLAQIALIVFDTKRHANGREEAFLHPAPGELTALALWLRRAGVRDLVVVMPHRAASLPQALKAGLANLDEHAVVELGFERVVFVRSARAPSAERAQRWLQRVADSVLAQLRMMTPQPDQPVRASKVAQFIAELARQLPQATPGTRVAAPELVWLAAQNVDAAALVRAWLAGEPLPEPTARRTRM